MRKIGHLDKLIGKKSGWRCQLQQADFNCAPAYLDPKIWDKPGNVECAASLPVRDLPAF